MRACSAPNAEAQAPSAPLCEREPVDTLGIGACDGAYLPQAAWLEFDGLEEMKIAIIHYWLVGMRGGEKVIEALCEMFPSADIYTHVYWPDRISATIRRHRIETTFIAQLPFSRRHYQMYLPLMPFALEQLDLSGYDLIVSSESGPAKGVITAPESLHVCYCHTPMRYLWSGYHTYRRRSGRLTRMVMPTIMHRMRMWDLTSAARVDHFIANSHNVADRIRKYYRRDASVIYPPVDLQGHDATARQEDFYLYVGQLVPYKGADIVVDAFNRMGKRLVVIGHGQDLPWLRKMCGPTIELLGWQDATTLRSYYERCRALVFAADEDFGMVPVEAMSAGRPVIALGRGGARETVIPGVTGLFFDEQHAEALVAATLQFESMERSFDSARIAAHATGFSKAVFKARMTETLGRWLDDQRQQSRRVAPRRRPAAADNEVAAA
jgi:glycosyltransferase involved in cell wall biosynthesis